MHGIFTFMTLLVLLLIMYIQDLAGVAHDDIDPSVFSISGDEQMVSIYSCTLDQSNLFLINLFIGSKNNVMVNENTQNYS